MSQVLGGSSNQLVLLIKGHIFIQKLGRAGGKEVWNPVQKRRMPAGGNTSEITEECCIRIVQVIFGWPPPVTHHNRVLLLGPSRDSVWVGSWAPLGVLTWAEADGAPCHPSLHKHILSHGWLLKATAQNWQPSSLLMTLWPKQVTAPYLTFTEAQKVRCCHVLGRTLYGVFANSASLCHGWYSEIMLMVKRHEKALKPGLNSWGTCTG